MGAILGTISLFSKSAQFDMQDFYSQFPHDKIDNITKDGITFGAMLKFDTPESEYEVLPRLSECKNYLITADAIIDNRDSLIGSFGLSEFETITDSELILRAYLMWGNDCCKHLIGDYAFAIFSLKDNELFLARDHVGKKVLYYYQNNSSFIFSTLIEPIKKMETLELSDKWLYRALMIPGPIKEFEGNITPYKDLLLLPPASYLVHKNGVTVVKKYWKPSRQPIKGKTRDEIQQDFTQIYQESIKCRIRAKKNVGIMLSSGLDSTSIASIAAQNLSVNKLRSFTHVPMSDYPKESDDSTFDESSYVREFCERYNNIEPYFLSFSSSNAYLELDSCLDILEQPFGYIRNCYWLVGIASEAADKNCSVLLDGQYGNFNVSSGNLDSLSVSYLATFKISMLLDELYYYTQLSGKKIGVILFNLLRVVLKDRLLPLVNKIFNKESYYFESITNLATRRRNFDKDVYRQLNKYYLAANCSQLLSKAEIDKYSLFDGLLNNFAIAESKISIRKGITKRDPTRDVRVIEYLFNAPDNLFYSKGTSRALIREGLKSEIPSSILDSNIKRGKQAADWVIRLKPYFSTLITELKSIECGSLINQETVNCLINRLKKPEIVNDILIEEVFLALTVSRFITKQKGGRSNEKLE